MMTMRSRGAHRRPRKPWLKYLAIAVAGFALVLVAAFGVFRGTPTAGLTPVVSASPWTAPRDVMVRPSTTHTFKPEVRATYTTPPPALSGTLSCSGLETLWREAGGNPADELTAAKVAKAESGGREFALLVDTNGTEDRGYWQINSSHGALSTYNPLDNARAAVLISGNGTDWYAWTTYKSGAYEGEC